MEKVISVTRTFTENVRDCDVICCDNRANDKCEWCDMDVCGDHLIIAKSHIYDWNNSFCLKCYKKVQPFDAELFKLMKQRTKIMEKVNKLFDENKKEKV